MTEQEKINRVLTQLEDEESKFILKNRWEFAITRDYQYLGNIIDKYATEFRGYQWSPKEQEKLVQSITESGKRVIIFGAGYSGKSALSLLRSRGIPVDYFCDNDLNKQNGGIEGVPVISPKELSERNLIKDYVIIIGVRFAYEEIYDSLIAMGVPAGNIRRFIDRGFSSEQYFDPVLHFGKDEVFVDGGCCDFGTSEMFLEKIRESGGSCRRLYAFEPDEANYKKCEDKIKRAGLDNALLMCAGLWSEDTYVRFCALGNGSSRILTADGEDAGKVKVVALDSCVGEKVTFIKLDVEGAELAALQGAKNILLRDRPKLAICIYHKKEDLWEIPSYIKTLAPEYKLYVRHYSNYGDETVLYGVCE